MNVQKKKYQPRRVQQKNVKQRVSFTEARRKKAPEAEGIGWTPVAVGESVQSRHMGLKIGVAVIAALAAIYVLLCAVVNETKILPRTVVNGVNVSDMTEQEATEALNTSFHRNYDKSTFLVKANDVLYEVQVGESLTLDCAALAKQALERSQDAFFRRGAHLVTALFAGSETTQLPVVGDEEALHKGVDKSGLLEINTTVQTSYKVKDKQLVFVKGVTGNSVNEQALTRKINTAVASGDYKSVIDCPMVTGEVDEVDWKAVNKKVYKKPVSATLDLTESKKEYTYIQSITGVSFDKTSAQEAMKTAQEGTEVALDLIYTEPEITTKKLKKNLFKDCLGTYTTNVSGTAARVSNIEKAVKTINNLILMSGDSLSYNQTLGERTAANGYQKAPAYSSGETVYEYGGGICQVSSTLYAALLYANMQIDERHNHTYASNYIGLGMDATVSWGGPDLRFTNNQMYPVQIRASYSGGQLTVSIWGTDTEKTTVEIKSETLETISFQTETRTDSSRYEDESYVAQKGVNGYRVQTYRIVYKDGKQFSKEKEAYSLYSTHTKIVYRGTMPRPVVVEPEVTTNANGTGTTAVSGTTGANATNKPTTSTTTNKPTTSTTTNKPTTSTTTNKPTTSTTTNKPTTSTTTSKPASNTTTTTNKPKTN